MIMRLIRNKLGLSCAKLRPDSLLSLLFLVNSELRNVVVVVVVVLVVIVVVSLIVFCCSCCCCFYHFGHRNLTLKFVQNWVNKRCCCCHCFSFVAVVVASGVINVAVVDPET